MLRRFRPGAGAPGVSRCDSDWLAVWLHKRCQVDVLLGEIYALERIMHDSVRDHPTVGSVLSAGLRFHASAAAVDRSAGSDAFLVKSRLARGDLRRVNLTGAALSHRDLSGACLATADLTGVDPTGVNPKGAKLDGACPDCERLPGARCTSPSGAVHRARAEPAREPDR